MNIEIVSRFFEHVIFVHGDDVLEPEFFSCFGSDFEGADNLTAVHPIEKMAVVYEEAGADAPLGTEAH